jgi:hypothetical protein
VEEQDESDESMYQPSIGDRRRLSSMRESMVPQLSRLGSEHNVAVKTELLRESYFNDQQRKSFAVEKILQDLEDGIHPVYSGGGASASSY